MKWPDRMSLDGKRREALALAGQGLSTAEIGRRLGISKASARSLLQTARRAAHAAGLARRFQAAGWPPETPLAALPLNTWAFTPLDRAGIATLAELRVLATEDAAFNQGRKVRTSVIPNLGEQGLAEIDQVLALVAGRRAAA